jgi:hypothetical protein
MAANRNIQILLPMHNLSKKLPLLITVFSAFLFAGSTIYLSSDNLSLREKLATVVNQLTSTEAELAVEIEKNQRLEGEIVILKDSIHTLVSTVKAMEIEIETLNAKIADLSASIAKKEEKIRNLTAEITRLSENEKTNHHKISELEKQRDRLLLDMEQMDKLRQENIDKEETIKKLKMDAEQKAQLQQSKIEAKQDSLKPIPLPKINQPPSREPAANTPQEPAAENTANEAKKLAAIQNHTEVLISELTFLSKDDGGKLREVNGDNWKWMTVVLDLKNEDQQLIMGGNFILQLYDLDKKRVVAFNEINPNFPDSPKNKAGLPFQYNGEPQTLKFQNTQPKDSKNYQIRIFYRKSDNKGVPLEQGTLDVVKNGAIMAH